MSILAADLTNIDNHKFLAEVRRRLGAGELTAEHLHLGPLLHEIDREALSLEVHRRLDNGDMNASDFDADSLIKLANDALFHEFIERDDLHLKDDPDGADDPFGGLDSHALDEAAARFQRRDYREMLWNLEKALGSAFQGLGDLKPEHLE